MIVKLQSKTFSVDHIDAHILAIAGVVALYSGLAAWAMHTKAPAIIPDQQIIKVSMVAPSSIQEKIVPVPVVEKREVPKIPPKEKGMRKSKAQEKTVQEIAKAELPQPQPAATIQTSAMDMTTGLVSAEAKQENSAYTEPQPADYLNNPPPVYPAKARARGEQGTVLVDVAVSTNGTPKAVAVGKSSGVTLLDEAAVEAVKRWKFIPASRGSELVEAKVLVPVKFRLN